MIENCRHVRHIIQNEIQTVSDTACVLMNQIILSFLIYIGLSVHHIILWVLPVTAQTCHHVTPCLLLQYKMKRIPRL